VAALWSGGAGIAANERILASVVALIKLFEPHGFAAFGSAWNVWAA